MDISTNGRKADAAYIAIRRAIVTGDLRGGQELSEAELMTQFDFGRTPVRESLLRLDREGFVTWPARQAPVVFSSTPDSLQKCYEARLSIERAIVPYSVARMGEEDFAHLTALTEQMGEFVVAGDLYEASNADYGFHTFVVACSKNPFMIGAADTIYNSMLASWYRAFAHLDMSNCAAEHHTIIDALRTRDPEVAKTAVSEHVKGAYSRQLRLFQSSLEPNSLD